MKRNLFGSREGREPFDPVAFKKTGRCALGGGAIEVVAAYVPADERGRTALLRLYRGSEPLPPPALYFGLCRRHSRNLASSLETFRALVLAVADAMEEQ